MKKPLLILPLVFLLCIAFGCKQAEEVAEEPAVDIAVETEAIREAHIAWGEAGPAKDIDQFMAYLADDVDLVFTQRRDKAQIRELYVEFFSQGNYWTFLPPDKIIVSSSGDMAFTVAEWERFRQVEGETRTDKGYNLVVWKKQADGSWKIVAFK